MTFTPAACKTISTFLKDTATKPGDYDLILTGDLGFVGSKLLKELLLKEEGFDISLVHNDCGLMIFDREKQDVHSGGSGCGCSASVLCSHILKLMNKGVYKNILFGLEIQNKVTDETIDYAINLLKKYDLYDLYNTVCL